MWDLVLAAVWLLLLVGWFAAYAYARQPKSGTLEWIRMYDRPPFTCLGDRAKLEKQDIWWLLGCVVLGIGCALWTWNRSLLAGGITFGWDKLTLEVFLPVASPGAVYLLCRMMHIRPLPACLAAVAAATCCDFQGLAVLGLACFYGWMTQRADAPFWKNALWLLGCGVLLCLPWNGLTVLWLLPVMGLCWLFVLVLRWRDGMPVGRVVAMVLLSLLWLAAGLLAAVIGYGLLRGPLSLADLPQAVWNGSLTPVLRDICSNAILPVYCSEADLWFAAGSYGIKLAGLFAAVTLLVESITRRNVRAAWLVLLSCGAALQFVFGGGNLLLPVMLLDIALVSHLMWEREKKVAAVLLPALTLVMQLQEYFNISYYIFGR